MNTPTNPTRMMLSFGSPCEVYIDGKWAPATVIGCSFRDQAGPLTRYHVELLDSKEQVTVEDKDIKTCPEKRIDNWRELVKHSNLPTYITVRLDDLMKLSPVDFHPSHRNAGFHERLVMLQIWISNGVLAKVITQLEGDDLMDWIRQETQ